MEELQPTSGTHHRATLENSVCSKHPGPSRSDPVRSTRHEDECSSMELHSIDQTQAPHPQALIPAAAPNHRFTCGGLCGVGPVSNVRGSGNTILPVLVPIRRMWGCAQVCRGPAVGVWFSGATPPRCGPSQPVSKAQPLTSVMGLLRVEGTATPEVKFLDRC
jgi:hypothetical protein